MYVNNDFIAKLRDVVIAAGLKECEATGEKIIRLVTKLTKKEPSPTKVNEESTSPAKNEQEDKKKIAERKKKMLQEEFLKKQKKFTNNLTKEAKTEMDEEKKEELTNSHTLICQHCREAIDVHNNVYGIPVLLSFSNNMYARSSSKEDITDEKPYYDVFPVVSSCFHYYHKDCFTVWFESNKIQDQIFSSIAGPHESLCSVCKQLFNAFLPFNKIIDRRAKNELQVEETTPQENGQITNDKPKEGELPYYLFDVASKKLSQEWLRFIFGLNYLQGQGLEKREIFLQRLLFRMLQDAHKIEDPVKFSKCIVLHKKIIECLTHDQELTTNYNESFSLFDEYELQDQHTKNEHELLTRVIVRILMSSNIDKKHALDLVATEYLFFKTLQNHVHSSSEPLNAPKLIADFDPASLEAGPLKEDLITFVIKNQIVNELIKDNLHYQEDDVQDLCNIVQNDDILTVNLNSLYDICKQRVQNKDQQLDKAFQIVSDSALLNQIVPFSFVPKMIKLPKTYADFNQTYSRRKCSLCNEFSRHLLTSLCLICGETFCQNFCPTRNKVFGNLNRHAIDKHVGVAIFVELQFPVFVLVSTPEGWVSPLKDIYTDILGENIANKLEDQANIYDVDFNNYKLNEEFEHLVTEVIQEHSMRKTMYNVFQMEGVYYQNFEV